MKNQSLRRSGFTLLEILVAITLIALLVGALAPSVLNQLDRGETGRVVEDLRAVEEGAKMFRVDVRRWPGDMEDLTSAVSTVDTDIDASTYPSGLVSLWNGTYIEGLLVSDGGSVETGSGGEIQDDFTTKTLGSDTYLTVEVDNLSVATIQAISLAVDGDTITTDNDAGGRLRSDGNATPVMFYLAAPTN